MATSTATPALESPAGVQPAESILLMCANEARST